MRNNAAEPTRSVAFRLTGRDCNRDAVGTRVEVRAGEDTWIRILQAGSGYISQSSKWLHFGVGGRERVDEVAVRWPDGSVQRFRDVATGRRYRLAQGDTALAVDATNGSRRTADFAPAPQQSIEPSEVAHIGLTWRVPLPPVGVEDFDGNKHVVGSPGRPLLVGLWASWCPSCMHELDQWTRARKRIEGAGVDILALAVDEIQEADVGADPARAVLERLGCWFPSGAATDELLMLFELLQTSLVDRHRRLPVPASFLIDGRGRLANIYKGPVEVEQLLTDVSRLELSDTESASAGLPFPGRWHAGPHYPGMLRIAEGFLEQQAPTFAAHFATEAIAFEADAGPTTRKRMVDVLARAGGQLLDQGRPAEARASLERAGELDPSAASVWYLLGRADADLGEYSEAAAALERSTRIEPDWGLAWEALGMARAGEGDGQGSLSAYQRAARIDPDRAGPWVGVGVQLLTGGQIEKASGAFRRAAELDPDNSLAWTGVGTSLCALGSREEGREALERALGIDPSNARARAQLTACSQ